jgi:hypothetical protein
MLSPAPARLPVQDTTQRLTALARTETLLWYARPNWEEHIAARPLAGPARKIFQIGSGALALARLARFQLREGRCHRRRFLRHLGFNVAQHLLPAGCPTLTTAFPVATQLLAPALLPPIAGPVRLGTVPATPPGSPRATSRTAVPVPITARVKWPFAALQQTAPPSKRTIGILVGPGDGGH